MGGIPQRSAETGSHVARLFAERQDLGLCGCDSGVLQCALWCPSRTVRCTRELLEEFGLDPALGEELWHQLQTDSETAEVISIPKRERQIMADWYACTWVDVRGCELKAETRRGVVPANPKADLLSSMR